MPPIPAPRVEPRLEAAEPMDIIVPRNSCICSRVRLSEAEYLVPAKMQEMKANARDSQKTPRFMKVMVIIPSNKVDITVDFFLPKRFIR